MSANMRCLLPAFAIAVGLEVEEVRIQEHPRRLDVDVWEAQCVELRSSWFLFLFGKTFLLVPPTSLVFGQVKQEIY